MIEAWLQGAGIGAALLLAGVGGCLGHRLHRRAKLDAVARQVTARYARLLAVKRNQLVIHDGYGNRELQPWIDHVDYFIGNVILREARARGLVTGAVGRGTPAWSRVTRVLLATLSAEQDEVAPPAGIASGLHYEALCRSLLLQQGWQVDTTPVTGDQGADLIAEAEGHRIVIQCKFYSKPVGNKAVQEAHAAVAFHAGDSAAVVSNAGFTRSAGQLARANGVLLLHHDQLADLGRLVGRADAHA